MRILLPLMLLLVLTGCMTRGQRTARAFVLSDAIGDAQNTAADRCGGGDIERLPRTRGTSPEDYRCVTTP